MPAPYRPPLEVEDVGDVTVVRFGRCKVLDRQNSQAVSEQLFRLVDELGRRKLLVNFGDVEYLDSLALNVLITLNRKLRDLGGRLTLCNMSPTVYEVFATTKLNKLFTIEGETGDDDPGAEPGGVGSRLDPPKPSGDQSAASEPPRPGPG
jgi:anti-sigma B factor antagonist